MWMGEPVNYSVQRNSVTPLGFTIKDIDGNIVNLSRYTIAMKVAVAEGEPVFLTIEPSNPELDIGKFNMMINGSDFANIPGKTEKVSLAYNILATDANSYSYVLMRGALILTPGV